MIRKRPAADGGVVVTFSLPDEGRPVSVVADFNDWDPYSHPMRRRSNGTRSVAVPLPPGARARFRYLGPDGFFDGGHFDPDRIDDYIASQRR